MGKHFNTVKTEVKHWRNFTFNSQVYDLSHLDIHGLNILMIQMKITHSHTDLSSHIAHIVLRKNRMN